MTLPTPTFVSTTRLTQAEFNLWLDSPWARDWVGKIELIDGRAVCEPPAGYDHSDVAGEIFGRMRTFVRRRRLGRVFESSCGIELPSGDTVQPDVSYISNERFAAKGESTKAFLRAVPELVVEVSSPSTARRDRTKKKQIYERNGVLEYWIVDRRRRQVLVFVRRGEGFDDACVYGMGETVASTVLDGFELPVAEIFVEQ